MTKTEYMRMILANVYFHFEKEQYSKAVSEIEKAGKLIIEELNAKTRKGEK